MKQQLKSKSIIITLLFFILSSLLPEVVSAKKSLISNEMECNNDPKPIIITMLPQAAEMIFSAIDLKYNVATEEGKRGFIVYYMQGGKQHDLVKYFDIQFTSDAQSSKAAVLIISKLKQDLPLEIKGAELATIFN